MENFIFCAVVLLEKSFVVEIAGSKFPSLLLSTVKVLLTLTFRFQGNYDTITWFYSQIYRIYNRIADV